MSSREIRIATRKSALALWQAEYVKARLEQAHPGLKVSLVPMVSRGDKLATVQNRRQGPVRQGIGNCAAG